jgi:hypothetical protein
MLQFREDDIATFDIGRSNFVGRLDLGGRLTHDVANLRGRLTHDLADLVGGVVPGASDGAVGELTRRHRFAVGR